MLASNKIIRVPGTIFWARYSFSPNRLKYCGPDANLDLFECATRQTADQKLREILSEFEAAYPYIRFIAKENKIRDPFDWRVAEAYWLGNELLDNISLKKFYRHLQEIYLKRTKGRTAFDDIVGNIAKGAKPHHSFHVLEIFQKIGSMRGIDYGPILDTINNCLIEWGRIRKIVDEFLEVEYRPLILLDNKLVFALPRVKNIEYQYRKKSFFDHPRIGDWVSIHWNWACDILTDRQLRNLQKWTLWHLTIANQTI